MTKVELIILLMFLISILVSAITLVFALRWKVAFEGKEYSLIQSDILQDNTTAMNKLRSEMRQLEKQKLLVTQQLSDRFDQLINDSIQSVVAVHEDQKRIFERIQALLRAVSEGRQEYGVLRDEIVGKSEEIERLRKGYDTDLIKKSMIPLARTHALLVQELSKHDTPEDLRSIIEFLEDNCSEALEIEGIKQRKPDIGAVYRDLTNVKFPANTKPASEKSQVGLIASVERPAYEMDTQSGTMTLLDAEVTIYSDSEFSEEPADD